MNDEFQISRDDNWVEETDWVDSSEWSDETEWQIDVFLPPDMDSDLDLLLVELGLDRSDEWEANNAYQPM